ncbi:unannotated protein [freshwater metagenome]|uniref:Unannotated protein n=1 Tax=freshwater metagenome TaxID=449393 RepID=A0A6J6CY36_9ZZZZ
MIRSPGKPNQTAVAEVALTRTAPTQHELIRPDSPLNDLVDLDHAATTSLRPEVAAAMEPFGSSRYGNPSGSHRLARDAVRAVDEARERIAGVVGCRPSEVIFTSGGTESDNHAITGGLPARTSLPICSAVEHHAVLDVVRALGGSIVGVDRDGRIDHEDLEAVLNSVTTSGLEVGVVSVMLANNEVGSINDLSAVAACIAQSGRSEASRAKASRSEASRANPAGTGRIPLHTDAVQAAAWLDLRIAAAAADMISLSAHKLGGPKGIGALVVRESTQIRPMILGGGQERDRRSGTLNVAGIVGFAAALDAVDEQRDLTNHRVAELREQLMRGLVESVDGLTETVDRSETLPGSCHVCIDGVDSESLLLLLEAEGVLASAGSSCASGAREASHVLTALGVAEESAQGAVRFWLGWDSTQGDVDVALRAVPAAVKRVREFGR